MRRIGPFSTLDKQLLRWMTLLLIAIFLLVSANITPVSFNIRNLLLLNHQIVILSILSLGIMHVFYAGEFDLSIGSTFALFLTLTGLLFTKFAFYQIILILLITVVFIGSLNAVLSIKTELSILATFITMYILRGIVFILTDGLPLSQYQAKDNTELHFIGWGEIWGIPTSIVILIILTILSSIYFNRSAFGQTHKAVGISIDRVQHLNIQPNTYKLTAFIAAASMALIASLIYYSRISTISPNAGSSYAFEALAVVVISNGGIKRLQPSPVAIVITASLVTLIDHYLSVISLSREVINFIIGIFFLVAILCGFLINPPSKRYQE